MDLDDRADAIEAAFKAKGWPEQFRISTIRYAARSFCRYSGSDYTGSVYALAGQFTSQDEIDALPSKAAMAQA